VTLPIVSGLEGRMLTWTLTKDGNPASYTGSLSNNGGTIAINATGSYILTASTTDSAGRTFSYSQESPSLTTHPISLPEALRSPHRQGWQAPGQPYAVNASDPDGDSVTL
jgi:hypothetical protein